MIYKALLQPNLPLDSSTTKTQLKCYELVDGLLYLQAALETDIPRLCIPYDSQICHQIITSCHDSITSGHLGFDKTYDLVCHAFIWPRMVNHIKSYVSTCDTCQQTKTSSQLPTGLLQPLPTPGQQWEQVTMDFIVELPETREGHNMIVGFMDQLFKMVHLQPTTTTATAMDIVNIFFKTIYCLHGLPRVIISDRDTKFTSKFWQTLFKLVNTKLALSTAFHPQTDGQTE